MVRQGVRPDSRAGAKSTPCRTAAALPHPPSACPRALFPPFGACMPSPAGAHDGAPCPSGGSRSGTRPASPPESAARQQAPCMAPESGLCSCSIAPAGADTGRRTARGAVPAPPRGHGKRHGRRLVIVRHATFCLNRTRMASAARSSAVDTRRRRSPLVRAYATPKNCPLTDPDRGPRRHYKCLFPES